MANNTTAVEDEFLIGKELENVYGVWVHLGIVILGMITNPMILFVMSRKKIGSEASRIMLMFLAVADMGCLLTNFFVSVIPHLTNPNWFPVLKTKLECRVGGSALSGMLTTSPWYIILVTLERFTVVYYPLKAREIFTRRKTIAICGFIPVVFLVLYFSFWESHDVLFEGERVLCSFNDGKQNLYRTVNELWSIFYAYIPIIALICFNTAIIVRLRKVNKIHRSLTQQHRALSSRGVTMATKVRTEISSVAYTMENDDFSYDMTAESFQSQEPSSATTHLELRSGSSEDKLSVEEGVRTATKLVLAASMAFLILMTPRGVTFMMGHFESEDFNHHDDTHRAADMVAWWLQYVNHSINFFIYVLAHKKFRFTS